MGYPTKLQMICRKNGPDQYFVNLPTAVAQAMDFEKGEIVEWYIEDKANMVLHRTDVAPSPVTVGKKNGSDRSP
jgi:hypothetical protein